MRDANIERLLGGYATNTLTDTERNALFEAALADQELFNALQDEETLRDLLEDVECRRAIQRALQQAAPEPRRAWLMPTWAWGLTGSALATAAVIFAVLMPRPASHDKVELAVSKPAATVLSRDVAVQQPTAPVDSVRENAAPMVRRKSVTSPMPATPKSVPPASESAQTQQSPATPPPQIANPESQLVSALAEQRQADKQAGTQVAATPGQASFRAASAGYAAASIKNAGSIPYSLLVKRGADGLLVPMTPGEELKAGDSVQLMLHPPVSGSLIMQEQIPGGNWRTIFPAASAVLRVTAQQDVVIPDSPMQVNAPQQLRLVLTPVPLPAALALSRAAKLAVAQDKQRLESNHAPSETQGLQGVLVTNVILAPGKASPGASTNK